MTSNLFTQNSIPNSLARLLVALGLAAPAVAQGIPRPIPVYLGIGAYHLPLEWRLLLDRAEVQSELKLTREQDRDLRDVRLDASRWVMQNPKPTPEERDRYEKSHEDQLARVLRPDQLTRVRQIEYRVNGSLAFLSPDLARTLKLSAGQAADVASIAQTASERIRAVAVITVDVSQMPQSFNEKTMASMMPPGAFDAYKRSRLREVLAIRSDAMHAIGGVLNARQRAAYEDLLGPDFDVSRLRDRSLQLLPEPPPPAGKKRPGRR
jgi:hypothetical protein